MIEVRVVGVGMFLLNLLVAYLTRKMKWIGEKRGDAIGGWVSLLTGSAVLYNQGVFASYIDPNIAFGIGIMSVVGILFVMAGAFAKILNTTVLRHPIKAFTHVGRFIGYLVGLLLAATG